MSFAFRTSIHTTTVFHNFFTRRTPWHWEKIKRHPIRWKEFQQTPWWAELHCFCFVFGSIRAKILLFLMRGQSYQTFYTLGQIYKLVLQLDIMLRLRKYLVKILGHYNLKYSQCNFFQRGTISHLGTLFYTNPRLCKCLKQWMSYYTNLWSWFSL